MTGGVTLYATDGTPFLVDADRAAEVSQWRWNAHKGKDQRYVYVRRSVRIGRNFKVILLHRLLTDCPPGLVVDHLNHDTLDNRSCNLRVCTHSENLRNRASPSVLSTRSGEIIERFRAGETTIQLGRAFGVSGQAISGVLKRAGLNRFSGGAWLKVPAECRRLLDAAGYTGGRP